MYKYFVVLTYLLMGVTTATAATWNGFQYAATDTFMSFFDSDTVIKKGDIVTLWIKYINNIDNPDPDGSYATAQKIEYSCKKRTSRILSISSYDKDRKFTTSSGASDTAIDITPDTIGEDILKAVCTPDFPKSKSKEHYYPVVGNDIYLYASNYFIDRKEKTTDLAPTTVATWNGFSHAFNDKTNYYFDVDTVIKKGDTVTIWTKYVNNLKTPDDDGSYSTAQKIEFSCSNNTAKVYNSSIYDKEGKFIRAYAKPGQITEIKPNTIYNAMLTAVCTHDFPRSESKEQYFPVEGNDIYRDAAAYYKSLEEKQTDLAPK